MLFSIYDTTLRDGTQGTGIAFSVLDKLKVAERLDQFGIHYIEGGWPGSNPKDVAFFEEASNKRWKNSQICAFGMTRRGKLKVEDDPQVRQLLDANTPVVTIVGKTWPLHVTEVFGVTLEENLSMIGDTIVFLKKKGREVFYDAEHFFDSYLEDPKYSLESVKRAMEAGASLVVLCDTNGGRLPHEIEKITAEAIAFLGSPVGIHTHNDGGCGVANAIAAVRAGAVQVQGTINGYGERVGNCNLTTLMPTLKFKMGMDLPLDFKALKETANYIDELANVPHDLRAPYVGKAAFTHKGGLHVHAVQKIARSYEHIDPILVGNERIITISDMSGQTNILMKAEKLGLPLHKGSEEVGRLLNEVKKLENEGYEFEAAEASFELMIRRSLNRYTDLFLLEKYEVQTYQSGSGSVQTSARIVLKIGNEMFEGHAVAVGPVGAIDLALREAVSSKYSFIKAIKLIDYKVRVLNGDKATGAKVRVLVESSNSKETWGTIGVSENIIEASYAALFDSYSYVFNNQKILSETNALLT